VRERFRPSRGGWVPLRGATVPAKGGRRDTLGSELTMWTRGIAGALLCAVGAVWIAQGTNVLHGSGMSGHGLYAVLGVVLVAIGLALLAWAWRVRRDRLANMPDADS